MENNLNILKKAKNIILLSDENWIIRNEDESMVNLLYKKEWDKASCSTSCCLWCFFLPAWIIYAILWWTKSVKKQVNIHESNREITITWDSNFIIKVFNLLKASEIWNTVKENDAIIKARKSQKISNILIIIFVLLIIFIIFSSL